LFNEVKVGLFCEDTLLKDIKSIAFMLFEEEKDINLQRFSRKYSLSAKQYQPRKGARVVEEARLESV
jgi:hypothetical protein